MLISQETGCLGPSATGEEAAGFYTTAVHDQARGCWELGDVGGRDMTCLF